MESYAPVLDAAPLAGLTLVLTFVLTIFERGLKRCKVPDTRRQQFELQQEVAHLQRQAAALNHPDTFAQSAKAERKAIALEKELTKLQQQQQGHRFSAQPHRRRQLLQAEAGAQRLLLLPQLLRLVLFLWLAFQSVEVPVVAQLSPQAVWPLGRWLRLGAGKAGAPGAVGLISWAMLCQRVCTAALGRS